MTVKLFGKNKKYNQAENGAEEQRFAKAAMAAEAESQLPLPEPDDLPEQEIPFPAPVGSADAEPLTDREDLLIKSLQQVLKAENLDDEGREAEPAAERKMNLFPSHAEAEQRNAVSDEALEAAIRSVQDSAISSRRKAKPEAPVQPAWETPDVELPAEAEQAVQPALDSVIGTASISEPAETDAALPEPESVPEAEAFADKAVEEAAPIEAAFEEVAIPEAETAGEAEISVEAEAAPEEEVIPEAEAAEEPEAAVEPEAAAAAEPFFAVDQPAEEAAIPEEEGAPAAETPEEPTVEIEAASLEEPVLEAGEAAEAEPEEAAAEKTGEEAAAERAQAEDLSLSEKVEAALNETEAEAQPQDEDSFLEELYALIGKPGQSPERAVLPEEGKAVDTRPEQIREARPAARITEEQIKAVQESFEDIPEDEEGSVPGWLKGALLLLISLLLSAMTFYAVASDVIGEIF